ncbi:MAG: hypothetical protein JWP15_1643 [Alphaproteobacteria bacterium]|nr:hypothetical protein [Alphaproteobacteria bacterium]
MPTPLKPHESSTPPMVAIDVRASRPAPDRLDLAFRLHGAIEQVLLPPRAPPLRIDDLWQHSCFEAFVRVDGQAGYFEFNLSPSTAWAAYAFTGYRSGMANARIGPPQIETRFGADWYELIARIDRLPAGSWDIGLAAVVEETDGDISHWALRHPPGKPDFHHEDCFALELAPAA